jgi:hypothetical protein
MTPNKSKSHWTTVVKVRPTVYCIIFLLNLPGTQPLVMSNEQDQQSLQASFEARCRTVNTLVERFD